MSPPSSFSVQLSEDPLKQADWALTRIVKVARISMLLPLPILAIALVGFFHLQADWYFNPFLALIFALFAAGQALVFRQMRGVVKGAKHTTRSLAVLTAGGDEPDLEALRAALLQNAPPGHLRDLLLRWIELGLRGETHGSEALLENAWDRRHQNDSKSVSLHVSLNRTTLKIGFLGTLYGLLITFPPMQNAVLGLADSEGEMKFIRDISAAIEGDELAILITLGATALSVLIELVTVQILERTLGGFDMVNNHINDWNLTRLQPLIRRKYAVRDQAPAVHAGLERKLAEAQAEMDKNLSKTLEAMGKTSRQIEMLAQVQVVVGKRVQELVEYEKQYRNFLAVKQQGAAPAHLRPEGNVIPGAHVLESGPVNGGIGASNGIPNGALANPAAAGNGNGGLDHGEPVA